MTESDAQTQIVETRVSPVDIAVEAGLAERWNNVQRLLAATSSESASASQRASSVWEHSRTGEMKKGGLIGHDTTFEWTFLPRENAYPLGVDGRNISGETINWVASQIVDAGRRLGPDKGKQLLYTTTGRDMFRLMLQIADGRLDSTITPQEWSQAETAMDAVSSMQDGGADPNQIEALMSQLMPDDDPKWRTVVQTLYAEGQLMAELAKHLSSTSPEEARQIMEGPLNLQRQSKDRTVSFTGQGRAKRVKALRRLKVSAKEPSPELIEQQMRQRINEVFLSTPTVGEADQLDLLEAVSFKDLRLPAEQIAGIDPTKVKQMYEDSIRVLVTDPDVAKQLIEAVYGVDRDKSEAFMQIVSGALQVTDGLHALNLPADFRGAMTTAIETCLGKDWEQKAKAVLHPNNSN